MKNKIAIFGAQASGKGTQAQLLSKNFDLVYVSTGNIFRQEIKNKTDLGKLAEQLLNEGKLISDEITNKIVANSLKSGEIEKKGFILDGYPRNMAQAKALEGMTDLTLALAIDVSDDEAIKRISGRLVCSCGKTYHKIYNPPKKNGICDDCGKKLFVRDDDKPQAIKKRLEIFHLQTEPLLKYYEKKGILRRINGEQPIPKVYEDVRRELKFST